MLRISIIIFVVILAVSCKKDTTAVPPGPVIEIPVGTLKLIASYDIYVTEPSGLSFGSDKTTLLTVSDNTNQVFEMDLQGNIIRTLNYAGKDLEGVTYNPDEDIVAVVEEADREVTLIDYSSGNKIETYKINIPSNSPNSGLEGISYNTNNKLYYIVNEVNPDLLITWDPITGILGEETLSFAIDYSGIFADADHSLLWFVSDQAKSIYKCDYNARVLEIFNLDALKYEGIVVDGNMIYMVNDATGKLYHYQIVN